MNPCTSCKYYRAKKCDRRSYIAPNPVTGRDKLVQRLDPEQERDYTGLAMYFNWACGRKGRFWEQEE